MGKFNKDKADALGIKIRSKYKVLQDSKPVMFDCLDIMVRPSDVMGPPVPGPIIFIVDCPTNSDTDELLSIESLDAYYSDLSDERSESSESVNCIIHLSPPVNNPKYMKWMNKLSAAQHIMAGHSMKDMKIPILKSSARIAAQLNYLCPQLFPTPTHSVVDSG